MEKLTWFKFVISDWMMGKIQKCPEITQARFMRLCCLYWNKECILSIEDAEIEIDEDHLKILLSKKIVSLEGDLINIKFLNEQNDGVASLSDKRRDAANARWEKIRFLKEIEMQDNANASTMNANAMQNDAEKRREEEKRKEEKREEEINKEFSEETASKKKPTNKKLKDFKGIALLAFEKNNCLFGSDFKNKFFNLIKTKNWKSKEQSAIDLSLKKLMAFEEEFASSLIEASIAGEYKGVVFPDTQKHYQNYLNQKNGIKTNRDSAIESRRSMVELATAVLTGNKA